MIFYLVSFLRSCKNRQKNLNYNLPLQSTVQNFSHFHFFSEPTDPLYDNLSSQSETCSASSSTSSSRLFAQEATPPRRVTKVSLDASGSYSDNMNRRIEFGRKELSPVISPWNNHQHGRPGSTSSNASSSGHSTNGWDQEQGQALQHQQIGDNNFNLGSNSVHPFAQRAQIHYLNRQQQHNLSRQGMNNSLLSQQQDMGLCNNGYGNTVAITSSKHGGGVTLSPSSLNANQELNFHVASDNNRRGGFYRSESAEKILDNGDRRNVNSARQTKKFSAPALQQNQYEEEYENISLNSHRVNLDQSFRKIIAKADNSISQAESILSSLRAENSEIPKLGVDDASSESEPASLGSDIETNIRRLEKTQAKINAALETFRNVQAISNSDLRQTEYPSKLPRNSHSASSVFNSLPYSNSSTAVNRSLMTFDAFCEESGEMSKKSKTAPGKINVSDDGCAGRISLQQSKSKFLSPQNIHVQCEFEVLYSQLSI